MHEQDIFVGRETVLQMIDDMVFDASGERHILRILGEAGVGKTCLLQEINRRYHQESGRILVVRIDYGESRPQSLPGFSLHVIEQFGDYMTEDQKKAYYKHMSDWDELMESELDPDRIRAEQNKIYHFGIDLIWQMSQKRRTVVLSDALDTENSVEDIQRTNLLAANLPNTVMIMAGRATKFTKDIYAELSELYKRWNLHDVYELHPFSNDEAERYMHMALGMHETQGIHKNVMYLTQGQPVLTAMSTLWLQHHAQLPEDNELSFDELQALDTSELAAIRRRFEAALVEDIRALGTLTDRALLYLSFLNQRYAPKILQLVLDIEDTNTLDALVDALRTHVFIRHSLLVEGGLLHEESQRLLREYVWPAVDPDGSLRQSLAQKVIDTYYLPEIERLNMIVQEKLARSLKPSLATADHRDKLPLPDEYWPKRDLQMECLYYHFCISEKAGWAYLTQLFDEALTHHYSLIQMDAIVQAVYRLAPQQVDSAQFQVRVAQILFEKGEVKRAAHIAERAVDSPDIQPSDAAKAFIVLADSTIDPAEKVTNFKVALEMAEAAEDPVLELKIQNRLGLAFRRQGHWSEAEEAYLQVLHLLSEEDEPNQYAATLNNLAFVYMLNGNPIRADNLAEKALRIRREQGNIHGLGFSYSTRGRIAESMGDYTLALRYHRTAVDLCELVGDDNNAALMQVNVAAAECYAQKFETARLLLSRALRNELPHIRARALQQGARIDIEEANSLTSQGAAPGEVVEKYQSAEKASIQALVLAKEVLDDHLISGVLLDLATIAYLKDNHKDEERWAELQNILKDHNYKLEKGRLIELEGHLAFSAGDIPKAFDYYFNACDILAGFSPDGFRRVFEQTRDKFFDAENAMQKHICQLIQTRYADVHPASPLVALKELCIDVIVR